MTNFMKNYRIKDLREDGDLTQGQVAEFLKEHTLITKLVTELSL